jgi:hypothetical protein
VDGGARSPDGEVEGPACRVALAEVGETADVVAAKPSGRVVGARGAALDVDGRRVPADADLPMLPDEPPAEIVVLEVEAVALVEPAHLVPRPPAHHCARERHELTALEPGTLGQRVEMKGEGLAHRASQRERSVSRLRAGPVLVDERGSAEREPRLLGESTRQQLDRVRLHESIAVEHEDELSGGCRHPEIRGGGEAASVRPLHPYPLASRSLVRAPVRRSIVDDDHLGDRPRGLHGVETSPEQTAAVPVRDHDRDVGHARR